MFDASCRELMKTPCVCILASRRNGTLYVGVTSDLASRTSQHKQKLIEGFTAKYNVDQLVYYAMHKTMGEAIDREKRLKQWRRQWKTRPIESFDPRWQDLFDSHSGQVHTGPADVSRERI